MKVATLKNPPKRKVRWPWILAIVLVTIILLPIILVYALFYDANTKKVTLQDNATLSNVGNRIIVDSLDYSKSEEKIKILVEENDIDTILNLALEKYAANNKFVKKAYMYVKGTAYNFYIDLDAYVLKSRLKISTNLKLSDDNKSFIFEIKDVGLGRVGGIQKVGKSLTDKFLNQDTVNDFIASSGLNITFDQENFALVYEKKNLMKDLSKLTTDKDVGLYFDVIDTMLNDDKIVFNLASNYFAEGIIDLAKMQTNDLVTDDDNHIKVVSSDVENLRDKLVTLIDGGYVDPEVHDLDTIFTFLFNGYDALNEENKSIISAIDFSYADIDDVETYKGFDLNHAEARLFERMKESVNISEITNKTLPEETRKKLCTLTEQDINDYIAGRNIVGYTSLLHRQTDSGYKVNYITVDNFYMNIYKNSDDENVAEMVCKIDVNGYPTSLTFSTIMPENGFNNNKLTFAVKEMYFGESNAENLKDEFFTIIYDALSASDSDKALIADKENYTIAVDFSEIMAYTQQKVEEEVENIKGYHIDLSNYFVMDNLTFTISGEDREAEGEMQLNLINVIDY